MRYVLAHSTKHSGYGCSVLRPIRVRCCGVGRQGYWVCYCCWGRQVRGLPEDYINGLNATNPRTKTMGSLRTNIFRGFHAIESHLEYVNAEAAAKSGEVVSFSFGSHWKRYLNDFNEARLEAAEKSLQEFSGLHDLHGHSFLDF